VANASAASVFFRVSASVFSVKFRVFPWLMPYLVLLSILPSVKFRVLPWLMLSFVFLFGSSFRG